MFWKFMKNHNVLSSAKGSVFSADHLIINTYFRGESLYGGGRSPSNIYFLVCQQVIGQSKFRDSIQIFFKITYVTCNSAQLLQLDHAQVVVVGEEHGRAKAPWWDCIRPDILRSKGVYFSRLSHNFCVIQPVWDGEHAGEQELVDGEVGGHGAAEGSVFSPELTKRSFVKSCARCWLSGYCDWRKRISWEGPTPQGCWKGLARRPRSLHLYVQVTWSLIGDELCFGAQLPHIKIIFERMSRSLHWMWKKAYISIVMNIFLLQIVNEIHRTIPWNKQFCVLVVIQPLHDGFG